MSVPTNVAAAAQAPPTVLRSRYVKLRALLVIAITAAAGLTVAVVLVATSNSSLRTPSAVAAAKPVTIRVNSTDELGATLNHSGRLDSLTSADLGAKLDHSGRLHRLGPQ
jgi:hypothetical protein